MILNPWIMAWLQMCAELMLVFPSTVPNREILNQKRVRIINFPLMYAQCFI